LLWPERFGPEEIESLKRSLGSYAAAGQLQQRPSPAAGGILKRHWWKFYREAPSGFDEVIQSWDCAFKDTASSDYVVGQVWGRTGADKYLLDQVRGRMDFPTTVQAVKRLTAKWPQTGAKLMEDKANGSAVIATLKHEVEGLIAVNPEGGKEARAHAVSPQIEAGNVYLPDCSIAPWVEGFIEECAAFPNGTHDDQVDAMSQALNRLRSGGEYGWLEYGKQLLAEHKENQEGLMRAMPEKGTCPQCDAVCVTRVPGGQWRCNACGCQWWGPEGRPEISPGLNRRDPFSARRWYQ
jgi:predicted phage terminase large subunit-like protein